MGVVDRRVRIVAAGRGLGCMHHVLCLHHDPCRSLCRIVVVRGVDHSRPAVAQMVSCWLPLPAAVDTPLSVQQGTSVVPDTPPPAPQQVGRVPAQQQVGKVPVQQQAAHKGSPHSPPVREVLSPAPSFNESVKKGGSKR